MTKVKKTKALTDKRRKDLLETTMSVLEEYDLNLQQDLFCNYYTSPTEFYGNGVQAYAAAYDIDLTEPGAYMSAAASASRLLKQVKINKRIDSLLADRGLNDAFADKQLLFLMTQNADFGSKLGALREYNKLKQRVTEKVQHEVIAPITAINIVPAPTREEVERQARLKPAPEPIDADYEETDGPE